MKSTTALLSLGLAATATAHYTFSQLIINDEMVGTDWTYIREHTRGYMPTKGDEILSNDFRCQPGAATGENTDVYTVKPGDKIALKQAFGGTGMEHPGPAQVYMSKAPSGDVKTYEGDGDWFKVSEQVLCSSPSGGTIQTDAWCVWGEDRIEFTLPGRIPEGEYLVRAEHIPLHGAHEGQAEFYYACAQVKVEGSDADAWDPKRTVKIPGVYATEDASINFGIYDDSITEYSPLPGPRLIKGGQFRGAKDGLSDAIRDIKARSLEYGGSVVARARALVARA